MKTKRRFNILWLSLLYLVSSQVWADYTLNMPRGITEISRGIHHLHMTIFWICVAIGILVFSVMFYAIIYHRKSLGAKPAQFHENIWVEIVWTVIPFIILVLMAIPTTRLLIKIHDVERDSELTVKVTGYQWRWEYEYLGQGVRFISSSTTSQEKIRNKDIKDKYYLLEVDNPLVIPMGKKVRFLTTSNDVIHSWWVPAFGIKRDAIPGFINEAWAKAEETGFYRGQCAELCGVNHGFMPIVVEVKSENDFNDWLAKQKNAQNNYQQLHQGIAP